MTATAANGEPIQHQHHYDYRRLLHPLLLSRLVGVVVAGAAVAALSGGSRMNQVRMVTGANNKSVEE